MRSSGATKLAPPASVVALTKSTMACFAGPSFHEGKGSAGCALKGKASDENTVNAMSLVGFMVLVPFDFDLFGSLGVNQAGGPFFEPPTVVINSRMAIDYWLGWPCPFLSCSMTWSRL